MKKLKSADIEVKPATPEDRPMLIEFYFKLLKFLEQFEHDILPTPKNVEYIIDNIVLPGIQNKDPVLIAWHKNTPIGVLFWVTQNSPFEMRWRMALGYGTYIDDKYRHKSVGSLLRKEGIRILRAKGIQKLVGMPHFANKVSLEASNKLGFKPYMRMDHLDI